MVRLLWLLPILLIGACGRSTPIVEHAFDPNVYIVQSGDTVYSISWRYGQDHRDVIRWNSLAEPYTIYPGQKLQVRATGSGSAPQPEAVAKTTPKPAATVAVAKPLKKPKVLSTQPVEKKPAAKVITPKAPTPTEASTWVWPTRGAILSKFSKDVLDRQGIDIRSTVGAPVLASRSGKVVYSGKGLLSYGRLVIIKHSDTFLSAYAHNSRLLVSEGDAVQIGQVIAHIGTDNKGTAKLHFEIRRNGKPVDPLKFLPSN